MRAQHARTKHFIAWLSVSGLAAALLVVGASPASTTSLPHPGARDPSFVSSALVTPPVGAIETLPTGHLYVASSGGVTKLVQSGEVDPSFSTSGQQVLQKDLQMPWMIGLQPSGALLVAGRTSGKALPTGAIEWASSPIRRLLSDGSIDQSFSAGGAGPESETNEVADLLVRLDGSFLSLGLTKLFASSTWRWCAWFTPEGVTNGACPLAWAYAFTPAGELMAAFSDGKLQRFNKDGSPDTSFSFDFGTAFVDRLLVQPDGKVLVSTQLTPSAAQTGSPEPGWHGGHRIPPSGVRRQHRGIGGGLGWTDPRRWGVPHGQRVTGSLPGEVER